MSAWTYIWVGGALSLIGTVLVTLGWNQIKKQEEAFSLSIPPSIEISLESAPTTEKNDLVIENTGQHEIVSVELTPVLYRIQADTMKITSRDVPSNGLKVSSSLGPRQKVTITTEAATFFINAGTLNNPNEMVAVAMVVTFRRKADNRRFVEIEPLLITGFNDKKVLYHLYSNKSTAIAGQPQIFMNIVKEILESERLMFRA